MRRIVLYKLRILNQYQKFLSKKDGNIMIFGVVVAGGVGSRMNISDMPKQFLPLGNKPIVIHTLEKFLLNQRFDIVYVGVHPDWLTYMQDLAERFNLSGARLRLVPGGADRNLTILNVIESIRR